jgi:hypothetical protein
MKTLLTKKNIFLVIVIILILFLFVIKDTLKVGSFLMMPEADMKSSVSYSKARRDIRAEYVQAKTRAVRHKLSLSSEFQALEDSAQLGKVLIKTGTLDISVKDTAEAYKSITAKIQENKGYISSFNSRNSDHIRLTIRVPVKNFHELFEIIKEEADKDSSTSQSITVEDVTAKYTDIDSRIKSKKAIEKRYLNILDKATKVTEILQIERELGNIRIEIERMEANLKVLSSQSHFSTIELSIKKIYEKPEVKVIEKPSVFSQMASSLTSGWGQAISFVLTLMRNWFAVLLVLGVGFTIRRFYRNKPDNENN